MASLDLPYRCPRCGEHKRFRSLSSLRAHLEYNHTYETLYVLSKTNSICDAAVFPLAADGALLAPAARRDYFESTSFQGKDQRFSCDLVPAEELEAAPSASPSPRYVHEIEIPLSEIFGRGKAVAPAPAPAAAVDAAYEEGLARLKIRAFEKLEVDKRLEKLTEEVEQKIASQVGRLQVELDRKSSELEKAKQESLRLSREKQELEDRASELSRQVDVSVEMLASLKQDLVQKEQELTRKQQSLCPGVQGQVCTISSGVQVCTLRALRAAVCAHLVVPSCVCPAVCAHLVVPGCVHSLLPSGRAQQVVPGSVLDLSSLSPLPAGTRGWWGSPGCHRGSLCQGGAADRPVPEGDGGAGGQRQGAAAALHRGAAGPRRPRREAAADHQQQLRHHPQRQPGTLRHPGHQGHRPSVATDAGCPAARPEGAGGKVCRLERGSPGHSSEVISPEILKMRAALFCIFTYLDTKTLLRAAEVCKDWKFVARHPAVWTRVLLENARVSSKFLAMLSQWCTQMHSLTLQNLKPRQRGKKESKEDYMKSTRGCLEAGLESLLKATGSNLLILRISHCPNVLTDRSLWLASCYCRALQAVTYRSSTDPVGHEVIWALGAGCRDIISLQVAPLHP
ncbi:FBX41 protein, partial [Locustella ochotensis]|nr:FBX41 protein [Locustella ochotensis]